MLIERTNALNVGPGDDDDLGPVINEKQLVKLAKQILDSLNINIDLYQQVKKLPISSQQMISIATALYRNSKIIILDEPTSSLAHREINELFRIMKKLRQEGQSIVFITHRLDEVFKVADRITILRDSVSQGSFYLNKISKNEVIDLMVGKRNPRDVKRKEAVVFKGPLRTD